MTKEQTEKTITETICTLVYSAGDGLPVAMYDGVLQSVLREKGFDVSVTNIPSGMIYLVDNQVAVALFSKGADPAAIRTQLQTYVDNTPSHPLGLLVNFAIYPPLEGVTRL
ncbi:hypothetical protein [Poriferisphaera sp. WC338]|uniref:hypothetical protein n=1 Tax=Poriferisphaera sp. WC338 TaxID=3425129 RepID=UPI003D81298E